ncbi:acetyltransferase [Georgenia yuyongxinii]|uniref:Acetyltransferase n=1 Tax=Georgenia yuyongxinii TaxID=2589797 RepID=A0A552WLF8_9MICO|nr:acetyltransferase [Georgenia yuyongxinii]TRW43576.1 acetyltransferase [Georgenia yuyongxinii]
MRAPLLLVAASGLAREVIAVVRATGSHDLIGVLDEDRALRGRDLDGVPVLGGLDHVMSHPAAELVLCPGSGRVRAAIAGRLAIAGVRDRFAVVSHPSVDLPAGCTVGQGSVLLAHVAVTAHVRIGRHVVVMPNATLTHDDVVNDYATLCAGVSLGGNVTVGEGAYVGMNASVRERTRIGPGSTIGMGAAVLQHVPPHETWSGVPARRLQSPDPGDSPRLPTPGRSHRPLDTTSPEGVRR